MTSWLPRCSFCGGPSTDRPKQRRGGGERLATNTTTTRQIKRRPAHLQVFGDEHLAGLLDHGLRLQLLGGELAFPGVEHFLAGHAGQSQVCRVGLVAQGHLDGLWVDRAWGVPGRGQRCRRTEEKALAAENLGSGL